MTNVSWSEPSIGPWLEAHPDAPGLNASTLPPGIPLAPRIAAALPNGSVVDTVMNVQRAGGFTEIDVIMLPDVIIVNLASELRNGPAKVSTDRIVEQFTETLDATYRGDAANRTAVIEQLRAAWPDAQRQPYDANLAFNLTGPRDIESIFPQSPRLDHQLTGSLQVQDGSWTFDVILPNWGIVLKDPDHVASVDRLGLASFFADSRLARAQVAEEVRAAVPDYPWELKGYRSELTC